MQAFFFFFSSSSLFLGGPAFLFFCSLSNNFGRWLSEKKKRKEKKRDRAFFSYVDCRFNVCVDRTIVESKFFIHCFSIYRSLIKGWSSSSFDEMKLNTHLNVCWLTYFKQNEQKRENEGEIVPTHMNY
jgi:hypothetical protein